MTNIAIHTHSVGNSVESVMAEGVDMNEKGFAKRLNGSVRAITDIIPQTAQSAMAVKVKILICVEGGA